MVTLMNDNVIGVNYDVDGAPGKSKDQYEPNENHAHAQQAIHDDCPGIPGFQRIIKGQ